MGVEQVHHCPEVSAFFNVHLVKVPQVVQRWGRATELPLLLDRGWFGVALGHDQATQFRAVLPWDLGPSGQALVVPESDHAVRFRPRQEDPPAVIRHADMIEVGPTVRIHTDCRPQVDTKFARFGGPHLVPPLKVGRLPTFKRAQQPAIIAQVDVVRNGFVVVRLHDFRPDRDQTQVASLIRTVPGPLRCQPRWDVGRSSSAKRSNAQKSCFQWFLGPESGDWLPCRVRASGENAARSSTASRTSSVQSMSSGANVTKPSSSASSATRSRPT